MLKIVYEDKQASLDLVTVDRRIWLDKAGQAVEDGDPTARRLYCAPGHRIRKSEAAALGIELTAAPANKVDKKTAKKTAAETTKKKATKKTASKKRS